MEKALEPKDPIRQQKNITLVFVDAAGGTRRQSTHVHNQTAGDLLKFLNFPQDGQRIVTGRAGQAIGLDEKVYDHVDNGKEVHIKMHPEARQGGPGIFPVNPATGLPVAFSPISVAQAAQPPADPEDKPVEPEPVAPQAEPTSNVELQDAGVELQDAEEAPAEPASEPAPAEPVSPTPTEP